MSDKVSTIIFKLNILMWNFSLNTPLPQVLPEVAHAEARDDCAHEGEAVQMQGVHISDLHLRHSQQAHVISAQGEFC